MRERRGPSLQRHGRRAEVGDVRDAGGRNDSVAYSNFLGGLLWTRLRIEKPCGTTLGGTTPLIRGSWSFDPSGLTLGDDLSLDGALLAVSA